MASRAGAAGPPGNIFTYTFVSRWWLVLSAARVLQGPSPSQARIFFSYCFRIFCYLVCPEIQTGPYSVDCQRATCGSPGDWVIFPNMVFLCLVLCVRYTWGCTISSKVLQDVHSKSASAEQGSQWPELTQQQRLICSDQSRHRLLCCLECDFCLIKTLNRSRATAQVFSCSFVIQCISLWILCCDWVPDNSIRFILMSLILTDNTEQFCSDTSLVYICLFLADCTNSTGHLPSWVRLLLWVWCHPSITAFSLETVCSTSEKKLFPDLFSLFGLGLLLL